jgi:nucleotide-binding universal stress UspA family protein
MSTAAGMNTNPSLQRGCRVADNLDESSSILLAVDGGPASNAAARVVADLARTTGTMVEVLTVERPQPLPAASPEAGVVAAAAEWTVVPHRRRLQLRGQIDNIVGQRTDWPIDVEIGVPSQVITQEAERRQSDLIALGLQPHGALERFMKGTTALPVVMQSKTPVLAVTPSLSAAPRRIVVAVDFSRASLRAARVALGLLADGGTLILTHVMPDLGTRSEVTEGWGIVYTQGIAGAFARLQEELNAPPQVKIDTVFIEGPVAEALLSFAGAAQADLIAVGAHRHTMMDRLIVGSVTETLVRSARRSLLVSPPSEAVRRPKFTVR